MIPNVAILDSSSDSSEGSDSEEEETESTSKTPDLRVCPLRSLMSHYGNGDDFSPILNPDHGPTDSLTGPVDPIFVMNDEESSGEAVAHAADQEFMPPLPELDHDHSKPPEPVQPKEEPLDQMEVTEEEPPTPLESIENTDSDLDSELDVVDEELEAAIGSVQL